MTEVNWEMIIFIIIAGLIIFAGLGIFIGTRISADKRRIRELESELSAARKDMETYRTRVNDHFKKTSELFTRMTDSYKAVYLHLAEGAQSLCTSDASLLKPSDSEFLKVGHAKGGQVGGPGESAGRQTVRAPEQKAKAPGQGEKAPRQAGTRPGQPVEKEQKHSVISPEQPGIKSDQSEVKTGGAPGGKEDLRPRDSEDAAAPGSAGKEQPGKGEQGMEKPTEKGKEPEAKNQQKAAGL